MIDIIMDEIPEDLVVVEADVLVVMQEMDLHILKLIQRVLAVGIMELLILVEEVVDQGVVQVTPDIHRALDLDLVERDCVLFLILNNIKLCFVFAKSFYKKFLLIKTYLEKN